MSHEIIKFLKHYLSISLNLLHGVFSGWRIIMSNHVEYEQSGIIPLQARVSEEMLQDIFEAAEGYGSWWVSETDGVPTCEYHFGAEGNYTPRGPDHDAMLDRLVSEKYNLTAWRETVITSSENGGMHHQERLRGTEEQQRSFRLQEISSEIEALEAERIELLGGSKLSVSNLGLSVRAENALLSDGLNTVADIRKLGSEAALLRVPNFGRKYLNELHDALLRRGETLF